MYISSRLCGNGLRKAALLITHAVQIDMDLTGDVTIKECQNTGAIYLYAENYSFSLHIELSGRDTVLAYWASSYDDSTETTPAEALSLDDLNEWCAQLDLNDRNEWSAPHGKLYNINEGIKS